MLQNNRWKKWVLIGMLVSLAGCFDYHEVEDVSVVSGIGVELSENEMIVHLELIEKGRIPSEGEGIKTITTKGKNFKDAIHQVVLQSGKTPYFGHTQVLIVDEKAAVVLFEILQDLMLQKELRFDMQIVIAYDAVKALFEKQEVLRAFDLKELLQTNRRWGTSVAATLLDYQIEKQNALLLPMLAMVEEEPTLKQGALYMKDHTIEVIDGTAVLSYLVLEGLFEHAWYEVSMDDGTVVWGELQRLKPKYVSEGKSKIEIQGIFLTSELDPAVSAAVEAQLTKQIKQFLEDNMSLKLVNIEQKFQKSEWIKQPFFDTTPEIELQIKLEAINQTRREDHA